MNTTSTLVLGATGKTGGRVMQRLAAHDVTAIPGSRSAEPRFDWDDADTWEPALRGVDAVYVSYFPDLAVPGATETVSAFAEQAVAECIGLPCGSAFLATLAGTCLPRNDR